MSSRKSEILHFDGLLLSKSCTVSCTSLMRVESDAKFEEKLVLGFKNDMMNLVNFNASSGKSENLHFEVLLLSIAYNKFQLKKRRRVISHDTEG